MKNQMYLVKKNVRLHCIWTPTGDPRRPLSRVWVKTETSCAASTTVADSDSGGLRLCA
jgi:hypothetical protein